MVKRLKGEVRNTHTHTQSGSGPSPSPVSCLETIANKQSDYWSGGGGGGRIHQLDRTRGQFRVWMTGGRHTRRKQHDTQQQDTQAGSVLMELQTELGQTHRSLVLLSRLSAPLRPAAGGGVCQGVCVCGSVSLWQGGWGLRGGGSPRGSGGVTVWGSFNMCVCVSWQTLEIKCVRWITDNDFRLTVKPRPPLSDGQVGRTGVSVCIKGLHASVYCSFVFRNVIFLFLVDFSYFSFFLICLVFIFVIFFRWIGADLLAIFLLELIWVCNKLLFD